MSSNSTEVIFKRIKGSLEVCINTYGPYIEEARTKQDHDRINQEWNELWHTFMRAANEIAKGLYEPLQGGDENE